MIFRGCCTRSCANISTELDLLCQHRTVTVSARLQSVQVDQHPAALGPPADTARTQNSVRRGDKVPVGLLSASKDSWLQIVLNRVLVPPLLHPASQAAILALLVAALVSGGLGVSRLGEGLQQSSLAPDGHYVRSFDALNIDFNANSGAHPS